MTINVFKNFINTKCAILQKCKGYSALWDRALFGCNYNSQGMSDFKLRLNAIRYKAMTDCVIHSHTKNELPGDFPKSGQNRSEFMSHVTISCVCR